MELEEIWKRLGPFVCDKLRDRNAIVTNVTRGAGHAGFAYFFDVSSNGTNSSYFIRLPPPGVKLEGTADVMRQVAAVNSLKGTNVPHAPILWSGTEERWFGVPYFVQPRLKGDTLKDDWLLQFSAEQLRGMAQEAMAALARIHKIDPAKAAYLGEYRGYQVDVTSWDRLHGRAAEPQLLGLQPRVKQLLLDNAPRDAHIGLFHGDFQWSNLLYSANSELLGVIDWELCGVGPTLNDLGWICAFSDPAAWVHPRDQRMPHGDELEVWYRAACSDMPGRLNWFKAFAMYKFAIITGFNLMLHRRGKRDDSHWEEVKPSMKSNMEYALRMLSS